MAEDNKFSGKKYNKVIGNSGEKIALDYLKDKGYKILETNFSNLIGEIDIIASIGGVIVFVEVKTKTSDYFGLPREEVTPYKQNKIRRVAMSYIKLKHLYDRVCRFDVVEVLAGEITHIEDCF